MRVGLILSTNLFMSPYVRYYTRILEACGVEFDILCWNRHSVDEPGVMSLDLPSSLHRGIVGKVMDYIRYWQFVRRRLLAGQYDKVVVFTVANGLLFAGLLQRHFAGRYAVDIRDYFAGVRYFPARWRRTVRGAALAVISSGGFRAWLPDGAAYTMGHNMAAVEPLAPAADIAGQTRYRILTLGAIGYFDANRAMIDALAGDGRFEMEFVGTGYASQMLREYAAGRGVGNVRFGGRYDKADEPALLAGASLLGILIDDSVNSKTCMANRFYLSVVYGVPMMVDSGTEQARWVEQYNLGVIIDKQSDIRQQILCYLQAYDADKFDAGRKACLEVIRQDNAEFESKLKKFLLR